MPIVHEVLNHWVKDHLFLLLFHHYGFLRWVLDGLLLRKGLRVIVLVNCCQIIFKSLSQRQVAVFLSTNFLRFFMLLLA